MRTYQLRAILFTCFIVQGCEAPPMVLESSNDAENSEQSNSSLTSSSIDDVQDDATSSAETSVTDTAADSIGDEVAVDNEPIMIEIEQRPEEPLYETDYSLYALFGAGHSIKRFEPEFNECPPIDCSDNTPPELSEISYLVDGQPFDPKGKLLDFVPTVNEGQQVVTMMHFDDPNCNLRCGRYLFTTHSVLPCGDEAGGGANFLPSNLPCNSADGKVAIGFDMGKVKAATTYTVNLELWDQCEQTSTTRTETFFAQ